MTPELRAALNNNEAAAMDRLSGDDKYASKWGATREDIQNARRIIGEGKGWVDRPAAALKKGAISLPALAALLGSALNSLRAMLLAELL